MYQTTVWDCRTDADITPSDTLPHIGRPRVTHVRSDNPDTNPDDDWASAGFDLDTFRIAVYTDTPKQAAAWLRDLGELLISAADKADR
jgi:hypothetical protein|tara:strand:- start:611 stop:874 length:264 start_codon:yes stop_codon:yes gene_type:complete